MFEKRYKNSLENILADESLKESILLNLENKTAKNKHFKPIYKTALAFVLCFVFAATANSFCICFTKSEIIYYPS